MNNYKDPLTTSVQYLNISNEEQSQRLDNFIYNFFNKQFPRSMVQEIIRTGQVRVNKGRVKHNYRLLINDYVRIPPIKLRSKQPLSKIDLNNNKLLEKKLKSWRSKLEKAIIFENQNILIINKPSGLAVHGGSKINFGLVEIIKNLKGKESFIELVHRLDRDTSGCIMLAKKRSYLKKLHILLKEKKITKIYSTLVKGRLTTKKVIELPLKKFIKSTKEHIVKVVDDGIYAKTICMPEKNFKLSDEDSSLITVKPLTGKTHQIRVHLASIGLPIANDDKYGDPGYNSIVSNLGLGRMFLHAKSLEFICPETGEVIFAEAAYDDNLINFLLKFGVISG